MYNKGKKWRSDSTRRKIGEMVSGTQRNIAGYLNRKTAHWSRRKLRCSLLLFCLASGIVNSCIMFGIAGSKTGIRFSKGQIPAHIGKPAFSVPPVTEDSTWNRLRLFTEYADSLSATQSLIGCDSPQTGCR